MNEKGDFSHSHANVYWKKEDFSIRNAMLGLPYQESNKIINSTHVQVEKKPLKKKVTKRIELIKPQVQPTSSTKIDSDPDKKFRKECTLKDLCKEDKIKITNLIKELAKYGEEKERALNELQNIKKDFEEKLQKLDYEKQISIRNQNALKEKLLEYELHEKNVENLRNTQESGNPHPKKSLSESSISEVSNFKSNMEKSNENKEQNSKAIYPDENAWLGEVFYEQQKQFDLQQKRLQDQIEQLQKLQESIVLQQLNTKARINSMSPINYMSPIINKDSESATLNCSLDLKSHDSQTIKKNKLDEYLVNQKINTEKKFSESSSDSGITHDTHVNKCKLSNEVKFSAEKNPSNVSTVSASTSCSANDKKEVSIQTNNPYEWYLDLHSKERLLYKTKYPLRSKHISVLDSSQVPSIQQQEDCFNCTISNKSFTKKKQRQSNSQDVLKLIEYCEESDKDKNFTEKLSNNHFSKTFFKKENHTTSKQYILQPATPLSTNVNCFSIKNVNPNRFFQNSKLEISDTLRLQNRQTQNISLKRCESKEKTIDDCEILNDIFFIH